MLDEVHTPVAFITGTVRVIGIPQASQSSQDWIVVRATSVYSRPAAEACFSVNDVVGGGCDGYSLIVKPGEYKVTATLGGVESEPCSVTATAERPVNVAFLFGGTDF